MAEAVCGPSNAVQNFQKHASVDRTLQQDRTVLRRPPAPGFRTASPYDNALDAEFQAFQEPTRFPQSLFTAPPVAPLTHRADPPLSASSWAADFRKLNLYTPAPRDLQQSHRVHFSSQKSDSWQDEFMAGAHPLDLAQRMPQPSGVAFAQTQFLPYTNVENIHSSQVQPLLSHPDSVARQASSFDEAAFEQAFEAARSAAENPMSKGKQKAQEPVHAGFSMDFACTEPGDVLGAYEFTNETERLGTWGNETIRSGEQQQQNDTIWQSTSTASENMIKIGSDTIPVNTEMDSRTEADELASTAGKLLDSLRDETSSKFHNSSFIKLMQQLRDREVQVEGQDMVSTARGEISTAAHPGGPLYPYEMSDGALSNVP